MTLNKELEEARALGLSGRWDEALEAYQRLVAEDPDNALLHADLGRALIHNDRLIPGLEAFTRATELDPESFDAWYSRSALLLQTGDIAGARAGLERALEIDPERLPDREAAFASLNTPKDMEEVPVWQGEVLEGKSLLIYINQGHGDTIMWARYLPGLKALGAQVALACQAPLVPLLQNQGLADLVLSDKGPLPICDYLLPLSAVPYRLEQASAAVAESGAPYLKVDPEAVATAKSYLSASSRMKVGLVWSGSSRNPRDAMRSMPSHCLEPLLAQEDLECYSLQFPLPKNDPLVDNPRCRVFEGVARGFVDDAALILALDCLVTVDTAASHLAGAVGGACALLLNRNHDPRWFRAGGLPPLYHSVSLYRQEEEGDWAPVIARVLQDLSNRS